MYGDPPGILKPFLSHGLIISSLVQFRIQSLAFFIKLEEFDILSISPIALAFSKVNIFPSIKTGTLDIRPSILLTLVAPPAPGNNPNKISGNPILEFFVFEAIL